METDDNARRAPSANPGILQVIREQMIPMIQRGGAACIGMFLA
jgi:hypothetical protein